MNTFSSRRTAQMRTLTFIFFLRSARRSPSRGLPSAIKSSTISALPSAKVSRFINAGIWRRRYISFAARSSGFMVIDRPSSDLRT